MIMLDTTACIDYLNGDQKIKELILGAEELFGTTTITIYEVGIGLEKTRRKISEERYKKLYKDWTQFLSGIQIFSLNIKEAEKAAKICDQLEVQGEKVDDNDILIAGIMLSNGIYKIITRNISHFERFKDLTIVSYGI